MRFSYDVCVMILVRILRKIIQTSCLETHNQTLVVNIIFQAQLWVGKATATAFSK